MSKIEIILDQAAQKSLALVRALQQVATVEHLGDGVYEVTGDDHLIGKTLDAYPDAVMKVELM